jgi:hypothetical protein
MKSWWLPVHRRLQVARMVHRRGDSMLFVQSFCVALATPLLMRLSLPRLETLIERAAGFSRSSGKDPGQIAATVLDMLTAGRPLVRRGCLTRGLALYYSLRRADIEVGLDFGLGRVPEGDGFDGHCWLVLDGEPYLEPRDPRLAYTTTYSFRGGRAASAVHPSPAPAR